jgi:ferrochelatase
MATASDIAHRKPPALGVLVINLGTPDAPQAGAIRRYLREFLSDQRVVDLPSLIWQPLLHTVILPFRPRRLVHAYGSIWTAAGSPLLVTSRSIGLAIQERLRKQLGDHVHVAVSMRYGQPSIAGAIDELLAANARRIIVLPLYPQYASSSTASAYDAVWGHLKTLRWMPEIRSIGSYHDDPAHIQALAQSVRDWWAQQGRGDHLLLSFHGIPQRHVEAGDPYFCQCHKTARLLAEALQLPEGSWTIAFQSRLGRIPWVRPYTDEVLPQLAQRGVKKLDTICPGFAADCLETLEEVAIRYRDSFAATGGELRYIRALNDSALQADALSGLVARTATAWLQQVPDAAELKRRGERVAALQPMFGKS